MRWILYLLTVATVCDVIHSACLLEPALYLPPAGYSKVSYQESQQSIINPGRGFLEEFSISATEFEVLYKFRLDVQRLTSGISLVLRHYLLSGFQKGFITNKYLMRLRQDLSVIKEAGFMAVIRFSYTKKYTAGGPYDDAEKYIMLIHIRQLEDIFRDFKSTILAVQAGFIGTWGEWYYTDHFGDPTKNDYKWKDRRDVMSQLFDTIPKHIQIMLRTPFFKQQLFQMTPTTVTDLRYEKPSSRIGIHNDCFLASENDKGTYQDYNREYTYLTRDTKYVLMGGETCELSKTGRHLCRTALEELKALHFTFLAQSYNKDVLETWKEPGVNNCYDTIKDRLGYRLVLKQAVLPTEVKRGGTLSYSILMHNVGYAAPVIPIDVYLILHGMEDYRFKVVTTPRLWVPGQDIELQGAARVPDRVLSGNYQVYMTIGKPHATSPNDYILFANAGVPMTTNGMNDLKHSVSVSMEKNQERSDCPAFEPWKFERASDLPRVSGQKACVKTSLANSDFEEEGHWLTFNEAITYHNKSSDAYSGKGFIELQGNAAYQLLAFPEKTPQTINKLAIRAYSKHSGHIKKEQSEYSVYCDVWQNTGNPMFGLNTPFKVTDGTQWTSSLLEINAPHGLKNVNCYLRFNGFPAGSWAYFDNVEVWLLSGKADFGDCDFTELINNDR